LGIIKGKNLGKINVTSAFLPPREEFDGYIDDIWKTGQLTNNGPFLKEFEKQVKVHESVKNFQFVANGTIALQLALEALDIRDGEVITTPFSYVATTSSILWHRCKPVFVDIDPETLCIDPVKIEAAITNKTKAIMPVHVFGNPCDVEAIAKIARKHKLKVVYDAAHSFGVRHKGKSLIDYGDVSAISFHATKSFHTIEGGGLVARTQETDRKIDLIKRFGHVGDEHYALGINAKANEFQAAMGLANLPYFKSNVADRRRLTELYDKNLGTAVQKQKRAEDTVSNYTYYPVILRSERRLKAVMKRLESDSIHPRRYFYPSLNKLPYLKHSSECPVSEDISSRILCLPLFPGLEDSVVNIVSEAILDE
jgi:dTDP-4-amino-4,6-dideoxygalactose transaminase